MRNLSDNGHQYEVLNDGQRRGEILPYHRKPSPIMRANAKTIDVANLKSVDRKNLLIEGDEVKSKFTIGFEVEKTRLHRNSVREYELFCGFERDGSCGYEAVTHVLPLLGASTWRTKVYDMMHKATKIIDDRYSPSDSKCGGHITIAVDGLNGGQLNDLLRKNVGIIMALFRRRFQNSYCNHNLTMLNYDFTPRDRFVGGYHHKYQMALIKDFGVEFRVVSRFTSVKQMMRRYELFYELVDFSVNNPNGTFNALLKRLKPIIMSMYDYDEQKVAKLFELAKHFRRMVLTGKIDQHVAPYFMSRHGRTNERFERFFTRNAHATREQIAHDAERGYLEHYTNLVSLT
jgi:hypothetical protein